MTSRNTPRRRRHTHLPHPCRSLRPAGISPVASSHRVGLRTWFEDLRWQLPAGVRGLNNSFTALYARKLIEDHPQWASAFELRRRRTP
ncbi:hypothetical protein [Streptomyces phaeochromogenes]|uniref:hypothetical protein n=1 Tax=Streptomyces phaeochromogenes TaxID=1923 RepID=UPI00398D6590